MNIAPLDVSHKSFRRTVRGYDAQEVDAFLALVASEMEGLLREVQALRDEARRREAELAELRGRERALQDTMLSAQKASDDIRAAARKEAEITLSGAELQAEKIVQGAHQRYLQVVGDVNELKRQRTQYEHALRSLVEGHLKLLDTFSAAPEEVEFLPGKKKGAEER